MDPRRQLVVRDDLVIGGYKELLWIVAGRLRIWVCPVASIPGEGHEVAYGSAQMSAKAVL